MSKPKIILVAMIALLLGILVFGRSYRLYFTDTRPDGKYSVQVFQIIRYHEWNPDDGYHDALIQVKNQQGKVLKRMWNSPANMCPVSWEEKGVLVGGEYCEFEK